VEGGYGDEGHQPCESEAGYFHGNALDVEDCLYNVVSSTGTIPVQADCWMVMVPSSVTVRCPRRDRWSWSAVPALGQFTDPPGSSQEAPRHPPTVYSVQGDGYRTSTVLPHPKSSTRGRRTRSRTARAASPRSLP